MEARSLTALNQLAERPPQYPESPAHKRQESLTLYIARVPGTRGRFSHATHVFLSTLKPQERNVTGEDVASCLYYIHLDPLPFDPARPESDGKWPSSDSTQPHRIPRKPVPGHSRALSLSPDKWASGTGAVHDQAAAGFRTGMPARKPVGPRAADAVVAKDSRDGLHGPKNGHARASSLDAPVPPRAPYVTASRSPSPHKRKMSSAKASGTPFSLRIVRRDPGTGRQWNVGRVSSRQLDRADNGDEQDSQSAPSQLAYYPSINVDLENSGYAQFGFLTRDMFSPAAAEGGGAAAARRITTVCGNRDYHKNSRGEIIMFSRQLLMEYSQSLTKKLQKTYQRLEQTSLSKWNRHRSDSAASAASSNGSGASDDVDVIVTDGPPPPGMKPRGYTFDSPWRGKCDFRTGQAGRSLICRHTPQDFGAHFNPLASDHAAGVKTVSDLRFNLPSSEMLAERGEQWKGSLEKLLKQVGGDGEAGDGARPGAVSPFKLNLGAERAGGGTRGRNAKLGKLIVHDEGLKMLDLVVAANMGIWWGTWERSF
ncbi:hypothetical protein E4U41_003819 [Claviceps citrina]|nr:hypothetical protein E4U41_003819 [Claviceps citrina]